MKISLRLQVGDERFHRIAQLAQQTVVRARLVCMRVITALRDVKNPRRQTAPNQLRHELERVRQLRLRISGFALGLAGDGADFVRTDLRVERGALDEIQRRTAMRNCAVNRADRATRILRRHLFIMLV